MLISVVDIPFHILCSGGEQFENLVNFAAHVAIVTPLLLRLHDFDGSNKEATARLKDILRINRSHIEGFPIELEDLAVELLDAGATSVLFSFSRNNEEIIKETLSRFPRSRVGLDIGSLKMELTISKMEEYKELAGSFSLRFNSDSIHEHFASLKLSAEGLAVEIFFHVNADNSSEIVSLSNYSERVHCTFVPIIGASESALVSPFSDLSLAHDTSCGLGNRAADLIQIFIGCVRTDRPDGLYTTVVCDEQGVCLGLVYSNAESIRAALTAKRGIYWSRSRGGLWRKGDTSGMYQELLSVSLDCDGDALRFSVIQHGEPPAFCHLLTRTCWGPEMGFQKLESLLRDRLRSAPEGSYTKKLFDDPR